MIMVGILILGGLVAVSYGVLKIFAGGMSDAPQLGDEAAKSGCIFASCGAVAVVVGLLFAIL
jgi:hypothetical protein